MLTEQRKYTAFWAAFLMSSFMLVIDRISGDAWTDFMVFLFGLYMAGNVGARWAGREIPK